MNENKTNSNNNALNDEVNSSGFFIDTDVVEPTPQYEESEIYSGEREAKIVKSAKTAKFKLSKFQIILFSSLAAAVVLLVAAWFTLSSLWRNGTIAMPSFIAKTGLYQGDNFRYFDGITINGIDVGGMTVKKANKAILADYEKNAPQYSITLSGGESDVVLTNADMKYSLDGDATLKEAKQFCINVMHGKEKKKAISYNVPVVLSAESLKSITETAKNSVYLAPVDATFSGIKNSKPVFTDEVSGKNLDEAAFHTALQEFLAKAETVGTINLTTTEIPATITKADLQEKIQLLASHTTISNNSAEGNHNMRKALTLCNNSIINPGEVWSFNGRTGNSNLPQDGWQKSVVYANGQQTWGYGGGICQASTTIYNAALKANLGIVERHCHLWASGYAMYGFDATIDYPGLDLKLKNNTEYPVYIDCYMKGTQLFVNIFGYHTGEYDNITFNSVETKRNESYVWFSASRTLWKDGKIVRTEQLTSSRYSLLPKNDLNASSSSSDGSSSDGSSSDNNSSGDSSSGDISSGGSSDNSPSGDETSSAPSDTTSDSSGTEGSSSGDASGASTVNEESQAA